MLGVADKRMTLDELVGELRSGMTIGIGGWGSRRKPMAAVRAILRSGLTGLTVVSYGGPDVGLLCAAGKVAKAVYAFVTLDSIPTDPHFKSARQGGAIDSMEIDEGMFYLGLSAASQRLPFLPTRAGLGSDVLRVNPGLRTIFSPYEDGEELVAVPALRLDAALVHVNRADARGSGQILGPDPFFDDLFLGAAERRYLTTERIIDTDRFSSEGPLQSMCISRLLTDGVVETPRGAHFTACVPDYPRDEEFRARLRQGGRRPWVVGRVRGEIPDTGRGRLPGRGDRGGPVSPSGTADGSAVTRAEYCAIACAEVFRGDGEVMASAFGTAPSLGARLARLTFAPDLVLTDGDAALVDGAPPLGPLPTSTVLESHMPYRRVFDVVWSGRRSLIMMASQIDRTGNQNISAIGDWARPKVQLVGVRGAPGNTVNHATSYWVPKHTTRSFVDQVDVVSGVGYSRAAEAGPSAGRYHEIRHVVSNLGVFDFETPGRTMRLRSLHPGVAVGEVVEATGFGLVIPSQVPETRQPTSEELELIRDVLDPGGLRHREVPS